MKNIAITISDSYLYRPKSIAEILRNEGLNITNLYQFGLITRNAHDRIIRKLYEYKEIISLKEDKYVEIGPTCSAIQWQKLGQSEKN